MVNYVDRTNFFMSQVPKVEALDPKTDESTQFNHEADKIYKDLEKARSKLSELSQLAKKRSLYVDNTSSIESLTAEIKSILTFTSGSIDAFERNVGSFRFRSNHSRRHFDNIVAQLKNEILDLTRTFKETLHKRAQVMLEQENRRKLYSNELDQNWGPNRTRFMLQQDVEAEQLDLESGIVVRPSSSVIRDARAEALANVQRAIGDLSQIFQKVTTYVTQQDEMINRIDLNTEISLDNVKTAKNELLKYYRRISSNRGLIIKVGALVAVLTAIYILFVM